MNNLKLNIKNLSISIAQEMSQGLEKLLENEVIK